MVRKASTSVSASGRAAAPPAPAAPWARAASIGPAKEKLTTSAPPPWRRSRREGVKCLVMDASLRVGRGALDGAHDAGVGAAAAQILRQRLLDLRLGRLLVPRKEGGRFHHHAVDAVAALAGLLLDE